MTERPRQHELEELSRRALRSVLPAAWIAREQHPDYGLDEQVQIVVSGVVTPLFFSVQLKGTDGVSPGDPAPGWSFATNQLRHYLTLPFPVMLALYDAQGQRLWYVWVHELFQACSAADLRAWMLQTTVTVRFDRLLTPEATQDVQGATMRFYERKSPHSAPPFELCVSMESNDNSARALARFVATLARTSARDAVRVVASGGDATVSLGPEQVVTELAGTRLEISIPSKPGSAEWVGRATAGLVACSAVLLAHRHRTRTSLQLLGELTTTGTKVPATVEAALCGWPLPLLYSSGATAADLLNASAALLEHDAVDLSLWLLAAFVFSQGAGNVERRQHETILERAAAKMPPSLRRGTVFYSLANALRARSEHRRALSNYRRAALDAPDYLGTSYWWHELAGCLFLLGRFRCSATCYARALSRPGADPHSVPLLVDALMRTGEFQQADMKLSGYLNSVDCPTPSGILLNWFLARVLKERGDGRSDRDGAMAFLQAADNSPSDEGREDRWREAVRADPLCGVAYYNLGLAFARRRMAHQAGEQFLSAALCNESDAEAWGYAILMLAQAGESDDLLAATLAAAQLNAPQIELQISAKLTASGKNADEARTIIDGLRAVAERAAWMFSYPARSTVRFGGPTLTGLAFTTGDVPPGAKIDH